MSQTHRPCYACGYLLEPAQDCARCPECGSDDQPAARATARYFLRNPARLFIQTCKIGRSIPPALWRSGTDLRLLRRLRGHRGLRFAIWSFVALAILLLVGPSRVKQYAFSDRPMLDGRQTKNTRLQKGPWHLFLIYDLCGEATGQGWINHHHNPYALYTALDPAAPRYEYWGPIPRYGWVSYSPWPSYRVVKEWDLEPLRHWSDLRRVSMIVFIPLFNWFSCLLLLHLLTWALASGNTGATFDAMDRRAALTGIGQAAFVPIRIAWIGVMLLVIPLLAEPGLTLRFRVIAYWTLLAIGAFGPCIVAVRSLWADRPFCLKWGRAAPGLLLVIFGCLVPGWLVRWGIYWVTFQLLLLGEHFGQLKVGSLP